MQTIVWKSRRLVNATLAGSSEEEEDGEDREERRGGGGSLFNRGEAQKGLGGTRGWRRWEEQRFWRKINGRRPPLLLLILLLLLLLPGELATLLTACRFVANIPSFSLSLCLFLSLFLLRPPRPTFVYCFGFLPFFWFLRFLAPLVSHTANFSIPGTMIFEIFEVGTRGMRGQATSVRASFVLPRSKR